MPIRKRHLTDWYDQSSVFSCKHVRLSPLPKTTESIRVNQRMSRQGGNSPIGWELTSDENHSSYWSPYPSRRRRPKYSDSGGAFYNEKVGVVVDDGSPVVLIGDGSLSGGTYHSEYVGPLFAVDPANLTQVSASFTNLTAAGTTAIARCAPTNPVADVGASLGEILKGEIPRLPGVSHWEPKTRDAKSVKKRGGDEYLNIEFGWLPLFGDMKSVAYAAANSHRLLHGYEQNAGTIVRRRYEFPVATSDTWSIGAGSDGYIPLPFTDTLFIDASKGQATVRIRTQTFNRVWFSGAFSYHLPLGYNSRNELVRIAARAKPLLGIGPDPDIVWNLMPWTWALDWFSNAGDVVQNLSDWAVDGLALKYGYIMEHSMKKVTYTLSKRSRYKPEYPEASHVTVFHEVKRRQRATPFGFGLAWNGLSLRQLAIAAALGFVFLRD